MAKRKPAPAYRSKPRRKKTAWSRIIIISLLGLALLAFILQSIPQGGGRQVAGAAEPPFKDMGDLAITDEATGAELASIDIELAQTNDQRAQGLMWRRSMGDDQGMLFIMDAEVPQSFWMLNTYIPLDIIYVDADRRIVSIVENTTPRSTDPVPSGAAAKYVLEVNGGWARARGVEVGDVLEW